MCPAMEKKYAFGFLCVNIRMSSPRESLWMNRQLPKTPVRCRWSKAMIVHNKASALSNMVVEAGRNLQHKLSRCDDATNRTYSLPVERCKCIIRAVADLNLQTHGERLRELCGVCLISG